MSFNKARYDFLIEEYHKNNLKDTNNQDEWDDLVKEQDEIRLKIYETLCHGMKFEEIKQKLYG